MKVDVEKVKRCREYYEKASELLEEIEEKVRELFRQNDDEPLYREDTFEPVTWAEEGELMRWLGRRGEVVIDEEGNATYRRQKSPFSPAVSEKAFKSAVNESAFKRIIEYVRERRKRISCKEAEPGELAEASLEEEFDEEAGEK